MWSLYKAKQSGIQVQYEIESKTKSSLPCKGVLDKFNI